jgi:uridine kinase
MEDVRNMSKKPLIIGVTGGSASGKTSVSRAILDNFPDEKIAMIEHDSYYKDQSNLVFEERLKTNYDHPLAFDTDLLIAHLKELSEGRAVDIPIYDYTAHTRSEETYRQNPTDVIIVEGILVLDDKRLRDLMDIKIFVDTDDDVRIIRRIKRDITERGRTLDNVIEQYLSAVKPMYHQFIEPTKRYADVILPEGVSNTVGVDIIITKIASILNHD